MHTLEVIIVIQSNPTKVIPFKFAFFFHTDFLLADKISSLMKKLFVCFEDWENRGDMSVLIFIDPAEACFSFNPFKNFIRVHSLVEAKHCFKMNFFSQFSKKLSDIPKSIEKVGHQLKTQLK